MIAIAGGTAFCFLAVVKSTGPELETHIDAVARLLHELTGGGEPSLVESMAQQHLATGGKRLRARLALETVAALGAEPARAIGWAAACEMAHNATLVHDDVQDGDRTRRGQPTVWACHGVPQAINVGDLMFMLPFLAVEHAEVSVAIRWQLCRLIASSTAAVIAGQAEELCLLPEGRLDWASYESAVVGKTGAFFRMPVEGAALAAGLDSREARQIGRPFEALGVIFQLQDDLLDLFGDKGREAPGGDLREGKISALVVEHVARNPGDRQPMLALLGCPRDQTKGVDVERAIGRFRDEGACDAVTARIRDLHAQVGASSELQAYPEVQALAIRWAELVVAPVAQLIEHS